MIHLRSIKVMGFQKAMELVSSNNLIKIASKYKSLERPFLSRSKPRNHKNVLLNLKGKKTLNDETEIDKLQNWLDQQEISNQEYVVILYPVDHRLTII